MSSIRSFADTSAVSLAYALDNAANSTELTATEFNYIPFTQEGFQLSKDSQMSTAISGDRRPSGSKNTKGSAAGSATVEFGFNPFVNDFLQVAMMNEWKTTTGTTPVEYLADGEDRFYMVVEKRIRNDIQGVRKNFFERYYGNLINETTIEIGTSSMITMNLNTMAIFGDTTSADADLDEDAGGLATTYAKPADYEIADASNNISKAVIKNEVGDELEVVFSDLSISLSNNLREQDAIGKEFTAGMGAGKVNASVSGTIYYYDDTVLTTHLTNGKVEAEITVDTAEGQYVFIMPNAKPEAPNANAGGENQDYTQSLTLNGERGTVTVDGEQVECVLLIKRNPV